jgi:hypothetical protein
MNGSTYPNGAAASTLNRSAAETAFTMPNAAPPRTKLFYTAFESKLAREKHLFRVTLDELAYNIRATHAPEKAQLPWLKLAIMGDTPSDAGCYRYDDNVHWIWGIEGDYDCEFVEGAPITFDQAVARLREAKVQALIYSTPSSTDEEPHWRVLCPISIAVRPDNRAKLMDRLNGLFGGGLASESWTLSQSYYFGSVEGKPPVRVEIIDGDCIDRRPDLPSVPKPGATAKPRKTENPNFEQDTEIILAAAREYLNERLDAQGPWGENDKPNTFAIACRVMDLGVSERATVELMMEPLPEHERHWITDQVAHGYSYTQNDIGCDRPLLASVIFALPKTVTFEQVIAARQQSNQATARAFGLRK